MSVNNATTQPANALEQRIYDLLQPFRDECYEEPDTEGESEATEMIIKLERKTLVLARIFPLRNFFLLNFTNTLVTENIAFLAHNHVANTSRFINTSDVFVVMGGWTGEGVAKSGGAIAVLVRYPEGTRGILKASLQAGDGVIDSLCAKVDEVLAQAI